MDRAGTNLAAMACLMCQYELQPDYRFCPNCCAAVRQQDAAAGPVENDLQEIITGYFISGYEYEAILGFLSKYHDVDMSIATLKRRLKAYGLKRRNAMNASDRELQDVVRNELDGPSCVAGYRSLWHTLRIKYGLVVPRAKVQHLLKELDPQGAEERRRQRLHRRTYRSPGPNECWHADGYDKLKPFGFPVHGAVDGYSRRIYGLL